MIMLKRFLIKYYRDLPCHLRIQHFNHYLKVVMKEIGLNDKATSSYTNGGVLKNVKREKRELITSHTARRSAATNLYLTSCIKTLEIMINF